MPDVDQATAQRWIDRWDGQQQGYMPDREERFTALIDAVEAGAGRPDPLVLDLGSGPGSLAVRLLDRIPAAAVVAVDSDPLLLALGRGAYGGRTGLRFVDQDMRVPGWARSAGLDRPADAAVSTTALHWISPGELAGVYSELASVLRPGGLFLDGDHLREDERAFPDLARLGRVLTEREEQRGALAAGSEDWKGWWRAATTEPALAGPAAERERRRLSEDHHGSESVLFTEHVTALRAAGFTQIGTLWQHGENRILCAIRGA